MNYSSSVQGVITSLTEPVTKWVVLGGPNGTGSSVTFSDGREKKEFRASSLFLAATKTIKINDAWGWWQPDDPSYLEVGAFCNVVFQNPSNNMFTPTEWDCESVSYPPAVSARPGGVGKASNKAVPAARPTRPPNMP